MLLSSEFQCLNYFCLPADTSTNKHIVRMIIEFVKSQSFTLTAGDSKQSSYAV